MKRLTRRIGVFGGAGSMMSAIGGKSSVPAAPPRKTGRSATVKENEPPVADAAPAADAPKKRSWFGRLFAGDEEK